MADIYDPTLAMWPDLKQGRIVLRPVRVGMDRRTGKPLIGWAHTEQSMRLIFATRYHSRPLRRWVGSLVPHLLGDNATARVISYFYSAIASALDLWEPNYRIQVIWLQTRKDGSSLTSVEELRQGKVTTQMDGVHRPRAHLGDNTPEMRRQVGLVGSNYGPWETVG